MNLPKIEPKENAENAFLEARLENSDFNVAFIDVNGLKLVNDVYGHSQGDLLIHALAMAFSQQLHPDERVFRFGGDEFVAILKPRTRLQLLQLATVLESEMQKFAGIKVATLAVGFVKESEYANFNQLIEGADALMYESKLSGRPIYREDKVTPDSIRARDPKALFRRDYFTLILKTVLQTYPELKNAENLMRDVRHFWRAYDGEYFESLSPSQLINKLVDYLPVERKKQHGAQKSNRSS